MKNSLISVLRLLPVLIFSIFFQIEATAQASAFQSASFLGDSGLSAPVTAAFAFATTEVVDGSSSADGCDHPFVSSQSSWECHHPMPTLFLSSSFFAQAVLSSGTIVNAVCFSGYLVSLELFPPASSTVSPPDHPPRIS